MTMQLDKRLNECTLHLNDGKLLAVLSGGDVVAQELKYHYSCLTVLFHKERASLLTIENQDDSELLQEREVYPLVFSELLTFIVETKQVVIIMLYSALQIWSVSTSINLNN